MLVRLSHRLGLHYGWVMVALTFLTMLTTSAAVGLPGAVLKPLCTEFGWTTAQVSSALAVRFFLFGIMGPFAAILIVRHGLRTIVGLALGLIAFSMLAVTQVGSLAALTFCWGLLLGTGSGLTALVLGTIVANRWFEARRGLVVGLLMASSATGQLAFLPGIAWLAQHHGWRAAVMPVCAACVLVAVLAAVLMRDHPADVGLAPYGASREAALASASREAEGLPAAGPAAPRGASGPAARPDLLEPLRVLRDVWRQPTFAILFATFFICGLSTNGLIQTHFITLCGDFGLGPVPAASVLAMMGAFDLVGTIGSGWLSDRYDARKLLLVYYGLRGLSLVWLPHSGFTLVGLTAFAMFYGLDWLATVPPTVKLATDVAGRERAGMVFGWIFTGHQLGAAVAAYGAGSVRTMLLTYTPALYAAGLACLLAALLALAVPRRGATAAA